MFFFVAFTRRKCQHSALLKATTIVENIFKTKITELTDWFSKYAAHGE